MNPHMPDEKTELKRMLGALVLSFAIAALGLFLVFLTRDLIITLLMNSGVTRWAWTAIDNFALIATVLAWLVGVLVVHSYFERGLKTGLGLHRFLFVTGIMLVLYFVVGALPGVLGHGTFPLRIWALIAASGVLGVAMMILGRKLPVRKGHDE